MTDTALKINIKELRIDNWVQRTIGGKPQYLKIIGIDSRRDILCVEEEYPGFITVQITEPILLTQEILEKAGFVKDAEFPLEPIQSLYRLKVKIRGVNERELIFYVSHPEEMEDSSAYELKNWGNYTVNAYWASRDFQYLHQLQNLYFALTGEELKINL